MPDFEVPKKYPRSNELPPFEYAITQSFDWEGDVLTTTIATQMKDDTDRVVLQHYQTDFTELREFLDAKRAGFKLVAVKPGYGRLIDADTAQVISYQPGVDDKGDFIDGILYAADWISRQPTIIPADTEGGED